MRAVFVAVRHVLREGRLEVTASEDEESIETLSAGVPTNRVAIAFARGDRTGQCLGAEHLLEAGDELRVRQRDRRLSRRRHQLFPAILPRGGRGLG